jgi:hypothetical protein
MITNNVQSIKWATAINMFKINKPEDAKLLDEFRDWYFKASTITEVPQPYRDWVLVGLPPEYKLEQKITGA